MDASHLMDATSHAFQCDHWAPLVFLSYTISVLGAYGALQWAAQIRQATGWLQACWVAGAAIAMGGGAIWSMHFIAMIACRLPVPVAYDVTLTLASLVVAIVMTGIGLYAVGVGVPSVSRLLLGGVLTGLGVAAMHYIGMAAMELPAQRVYRPVIVVASVMIAIVAATAALWLAFNVRRGLRWVASSLVMGGAVCGMHYTAMAAVTFIPASGLAASTGLALKSEQLGFIVFGLTLFVLAMLSLGSNVINRKQNEELLRRAHDELGAALLLLRAADQRKDEFLAMLGHELRNPLAATANALQLMRETADSRTRARALDIADRQTRNLARMVDDLLDISRITLGKLAMQRAQIDLGASVRRASESARTAVEAAGQTLVVRLPPRGPWLNGDAARLEQLVANLLANAARYAGGGAQVTVDLEDAGTTARLSVGDNGVGIGPELLPHIFEQFTQGAQPRSGGGLGIGLALVHTIVGMHGGEVRAHSGGPGHGAQFVVELPATPGPVAAVAAPALAPAPPSTLRILVVDDNADSAEMLSTVLQQWGHDVCVAGDGESALTEVARSHPQVVLLDIGLPGMSGYAVAERLSHAEGTRPVLIALTAYGHRDDIKRAREAGFDRHILKPVDFVRLREALADTDTRA